LAGPGARREHRHDTLVERQQADRIALACHQISERGRQIRAVFELAETLGAIAHRGAHIQQDVALEIGFGLILLDEVSIGARVDLPVERGQVITRQVLAIFREFDAEALVRAPMQAR
jgi:hypothetical protein